MTGDAASSRVNRTGDLIALAVRWLLAAVFIFMGLNKALHPVEFLKLVRAYGVLDQPWPLNFVAVVLPWFEITAGLLLLAGVAVRGTAVLLLAMLAGFTALVWWRALGLRAAGGLPFCALRLDCGCGVGEVLVCRKLAENAALALLALWLVIGRPGRFCLRPELFGPSGR